MNRSINHSIQIVSPGDEARIPESFLLIGVVESFHEVRSVDLLQRRVEVIRHRAGVRDERYPVPGELAEIGIR